MDHRRKKELKTFIAVLLFIGVTFAFGVLTLRTMGETQDPILADASATTAPAAVPAIATSTPTSTPPAPTSTAATSSATSSPARSTPAVSTSTPKRVGAVALTKPPKVATTSASATSTASAKPTAAKTPPKPAPAPALKPATTTKSLPFVATIFSKGQAWQSYWGSFTLATASLTLASKGTGTSGGVLLGGTNGWSDYSFQATVNWTEGQTFGLIARYQNSSNYVVCVFNQEAPDYLTIELQQLINGKTYTLVSGSVTGYEGIGKDGVVADINVQNVLGSCSIDGHTVFSSQGNNQNTQSTINPPFNGRIGFTAWDPEPANSKIVVTGVDAESNH